MRRRRIVCLAVLAVLAAACGGGERASSVAVLDAAPDDRGVLVERQQGPVRVRLVDLGDEGICLMQVVDPPPGEPPGDLPVVQAFPDAGALGCTTREQRLANVERDGWDWMEAQRDDGESLVTDLVPDGYDEAVGADGSVWPIRDNLLIISAVAGEVLPTSVELRGPDGRRTIPITTG